VPYDAYLRVVDEVEPALSDEILKSIGTQSWRIIKDEEGLDEYNRASQLIGIADGYRLVGVVQRALNTALMAESQAEKARYSAPSIWCELARFYVSLPLKDEAARCIVEARSLFSHVADVNEAVLSGQEGRRWMLELPSLDDYKTEVDDTEQALSQASSTPVFDPGRTAYLMAPDDTSRNRIREALEHAMVDRGFKKATDQTFTWV